MATKRDDVLLPIDRNDINRRFYIRVQVPKTSKVAARKQFARCDDDSILIYMEALAEGLGPIEKVYSGSSSCFKSRWNRFWDGKGVLRGAEEGLNSASLRTGGAILTC